MSQADLVYRIIAIIFPVFSIVAAGYLYARYRRNTDMSSGNRLNMEIFIPALIFDTLSARDYALSDYLLLTLGGALVVLGSGLLSWPVARLFGYQWKTFGQVKPHLIAKDATGSGPGAVGLRHAGLQDCPH